MSTSVRPGSTISVGPDGIKITTGVPKITPLTNFITELTRRKAEESASVTAKPATPISAVSGETQPTVRVANQPINQQSDPERSNPGHLGVNAPVKETNPVIGFASDKGGQTQAVSNIPVTASSKISNGHGDERITLVDGRAPLVAGISKTRHRNVSYPKNTALARAITAASSLRPDGPVPDTRLPVATRPATFTNDGRSSGAPCRIAINDGRHFGAVTSAQNGHSSTVQDGRTQMVSRNQAQTPALSLPLVNMIKPAPLPRGKYYRYYQVVETRENPQKVERFLRNNDVEHEIVGHPTAFTSVRDALTELKNLKETMRINLVKERNYRDTEVKCLQGLVELCVEQARQIEANSKTMIRSAAINYLNSQQGFLQFIAMVRGQVLECLSNIKTDLHIPVDLSEPGTSAIPTKTGQAVRQVQLQKSQRPQEEINAGELMMAGPEYTAECRRRQAIMERHAVKVPPAAYQRAFVRSRGEPMNPAHNPPMAPAKPQAQNIVRLESSQQHTPSGDPNHEKQQEKETSNEEPDDMEPFVDIEDDHSSGIIFPLAESRSSKFETTPSPAAPLPAGHQSNGNFPVVNIVDCELQSESSRIGNHPMPTGIIGALNVGDISHLRYADFEWLRDVQNDELKKKLMPVYNLIDWKEYGRLYRIMKRASLNGKKIAEEKLDEFFAPEKLKIKRAVEQNNHFGNTQSPAGSSSEILLDNQWLRSSPSSHTGSTPSPHGPIPVVVSADRPITLAETRANFDNVLRQVTMDAEKAAKENVNQSRPPVPPQVVKFPHSSGLNTPNFKAQRFTGGRVLCRLCKDLRGIHNLKDLMNHSKMHFDRLKINCTTTSDWMDFVNRTYPELIEKVFRKVPKNETNLAAVVVNASGELPLDQLEHDYPCQECGEIIHLQQGKTIELVCQPLVDHLLRKHYRCKPHMCQECGYINAHEWIIRLHISVRHSEKALVIKPVKDRDTDNAFLFVREMFPGIESVIGEYVDEEQNEITEAISNIQRNRLTQEGLQKPPGGERRMRLIAKPIKRGPIFEEERTVEDNNVQIDVQKALEMIVQNAPVAKNEPEEAATTSGAQQSCSVTVKTEPIDEWLDNRDHTGAVINKDNDNVSTEQPAAEQEAEKTSAQEQQAEEPRGQEEQMEVHQEEQAEEENAEERQAEEEQAVEEQAEEAEAEEEQAETDDSIDTVRTEEQAEDSFTSAVDEEEEDDDSLDSEVEDDDYDSEATDLDESYEPKTLKCQLCSDVFTLDPYNEYAEVKMLYSAIDHNELHFRLKKYECSCGKYGHVRESDVKAHAKEKGAGHEVLIHDNSFMHSYLETVFNKCFPNFKKTWDVSNICFGRGHGTVPEAETMQLMFKRFPKAKELFRKRSHTENNDLHDLESPPKKPAVELPIPEALPIPEPLPAPEPFVKRGRGRPPGSKSKSKLVTTLNISMTSTSGAPVKRGRGRPLGSKTKSKLTTTLNASMTSTSRAIRAAGRSRD